MVLEQREVDTNVIDEVGLISERPAPGNSQLSRQRWHRNLTELEVVLLEASADLTEFEVGDRNKVSGSAVGDGNHSFSNPLDASESVIAVDSAHEWVGSDIGVAKKEARAFRRPRVLTIWKTERELAEIGTGAIVLHRTTQ